MSLKGREREDGVRSAWSAMGGVGKGEREDGDGWMNFWVKTKFEVLRGWAVWSLVLGGWVLMVVSGWFWLEVGGRGKMEESGRGDEEGENF
jgi:hypothetical protein